ncbi:hypothetical protein P3X46_007157 [Hevea brasiliensis]|uniref:Uncharacterized protein n=1 Tax=Hevea brasiliensis TaxID=3981 RepID=A0ABQ9MWB1_HEVBR|nr:hypothetical protein P3X46_007157 [Hevea brasiliensis]
MSWSSIAGARISPHLKSILQNRNLKSWISVPRCEVSTPTIAHWLGNSCIKNHYATYHGSTSTEQKSRKMLIYLTGLVIAMVGNVYAASVEEKIARHAKEGTVTTRVKPGESALAFYAAENRSSTPITGVSTYNMTPMKYKMQKVVYLLYPKISCWRYMQPSLLPLLGLPLEPQPQQIVLRNDLLLPFRFLKIFYFLRSNTRRLTSVSAYS